MERYIRRGHYREIQLHLSAGLATLKIALADGFFERISQTANNLAQGLNEVAAAMRSRFLRAIGGGYDWNLFSRIAAAKIFDEVKKCDANQFRRFFSFDAERGAFILRLLLLRQILSATVTAKKRLQKLSPPRKILAGNRRQQVDFALRQNSNAVYHCLPSEFSRILCVVARGIC